jgi:hypothetical protein
MKKRVPPKFPKVDGVVTLPDGRELCSPSVRKKRKLELWRSDPHCANPFCKRWLVAPEYGELAHKESKKMGGAKTNDSPSNLCLTCIACNRRQGSISWDTFLRSERKIKQETKQNFLDKLLYPDLL